MLRHSIILIVFASLLLTSFAIAQDDVIVNYQGRLTDSDGEPVIDAMYPVEIILFPDSTGGSPMGAPSFFDVQTNIGNFRFQLAVEPEIFEWPMFIEIWVEGEQMAPRQRITHAPFSAVTRKVNGDILTTPGSVKIHRPDPCIPDPCPDSIKFQVAPNHAAFSVSGGSSDGSESSVGVSSGEGEAGIIIIHGMPDGSENSIELNTNSDDAGIIIVHGAPDPAEEGSSAQMTTGLGNASIVIQNMPVVGEEGSQLQFSANLGNAGIVIQNMPTPGEEGASAQMTTGLGNAGIVIQNMPAGTEGVSSAQVNSGLDETGIIIVHGVPGPDTQDISAELTVDDLGSHFNMGIPEAAGANTTIPAPFMSMNSSINDEINMLMFNPQPEPPGANPFIEMRTTSEGGSLNLSHPGGIYMGTEPSPFAPGGALKMYDSAGSPSVELNSNGNVLAQNIGIGTTTPTHALTVFGEGWFSGEVYTITETITKRNIEPIENALDKIDRMNGYYYELRADEYPELNMREGRSIGFLAEEVKEVVPEVVSDANDGLMGVSYAKISALLVEAVKELKAGNEELRDRIEQLENK